MQKLPVILIEQSLKISMERKLNNNQELSLIKNNTIVGLKTNKVKQGAIERH